MKTLETGRLILRDWRTDEAEAMFEYAKNPNVGPNAGWPAHQSIEESQKIVQQFAKGDEVWAVVGRESGVPIGSLGVHPDRKRDIPGSRMIGYVLGEEWWGKGLMTEAVARALQFLFEETDVSIVSVYHYPFNARSRRVIEKAGFVYEGTLRMASRLPDGRVVDDMCYSITREEYFARRGVTALTR
ncbi:MAG: GNAT family N-acetyltransferase [Clostridiales bacterium]|nr:GNAT family N-acetyltransferase [Clostridiales bacterium]